MKGKAWNSKDRMKYDIKNDGSKSKKGFRLAPQPQRHIDTPMNSEFNLVVMSKTE